MHIRNSFTNQFKGLGIVEKIQSLLISQTRLLGKQFDNTSIFMLKEDGIGLHLDEFVQLPIAQTGMNEIEQSLPAQLPLNEIVQSSIAQIDMPFVNMPKILVLNTFTCHIEILNRCKSYDERVFYMLYAARQRLNTFALGRGCQSHRQRHQNKN